MKMMKIMTVLATLTLVATDRTCAVAPAAQSALPSKPVEKDGLQMAVTLPKATFAASEQPKFTVRFRNVSDKPITLYDEDWFWDWNIRFEDEARNGSWQPHLLVMVKRQPSLCTYKPGESAEVMVDFGKEALLFEYQWKGAQEQPVKSLEQLHPGKYRLVIEMNRGDPLNRPARPAGCWAGRITTEPVEFRIADKPAATIK